MSISSQSKEKINLTLKDVLSLPEDNELKRKFIALCKTEHSMENINFLSDLEKVKENDIEGLHDISKKYISLVGAEQINVSHDLKKVVFSALEEGSLTKKTFDGCRNEVMKMVSQDTFERFIKEVEEQSSNQAKKLDGTLKKKIKEISEEIRKKANMKPGEIDELKRKYEELIKKSAKATSLINPENKGKILAQNERLLNRMIELAIMENYVARKGAKSPEGQKMKDLSTFVKGIYDSAAKDNDRPLDVKEIGDLKHQYESAYAAYKANVQSRWGGLGGSEGSIWKHFIAPKIEEYAKQLKGFIPPKDFMPHEKGTESIRMQKAIAGMSEAQRGWSPIETTHALQNCFETRKHEKKELTSPATTMTQKPVDDSTSTPSIPTKTNPSIGSLRAPTAEGSEPENPDTEQENKGRSRR